MENKILPDFKQQVIKTFKEDELLDILSQVPKTFDIHDSREEKIFDGGKYEMEIENNENLKSIANYNFQISKYNKQLVDLNCSMLAKINSINTLLDFIIELIRENTQITKKGGIEHNALLLELIRIMDSKDKDNIKEFLEGLTGNVAAGLIVEYLKYKLGICQSA